MKTFQKNQKGNLFSFIASFALIVTIAFSCEKEGKGFSFNSPEKSSSSEQINVTASTLTIKQSLKQINALFSDELYPIMSRQVQAASKQQFIKWLRNSNVAKAEEKYLGPLLSSDTSEFLLLRNVTLRETNEQATIAMVAVPQELSGSYSKLLVIKDVNHVFIGRPCFWFECDYSGDMCICLSRIGNVALNAPCPASTCDPHNSSSCERAGQHCENLDVEDLFSPWY